MFSQNTMIGVYVVLNILFIVSIYNSIPNLRTILVVLEFVVLISPFIRISFKSKKQRVYFFYLISVILSEIILLFSLRSIRNIFPLPAVSEDKVISYSQFFQYPIYFDAFFFMAFCSIPVLISLFLNIMYKRKWLV